MTERRALVSGDELDGRYVLQDLVAEQSGATSWRAHDKVLLRNVGLEMLPGDDPRADEFLAAARQASAVSDPRFLRVLDLVVDEQGHHIVLREWARAVTLDQLLAQSPMPSRRAAQVIAEVADAVAYAHANGVFHRALTPRHVLLKESGGVRIVGLGTASALVQPSDGPADLHAYAEADVTALGKLLYACLVSRWPGGPIDLLRPAPTEHGRLLRPRQVRAGVSREVDAICDQILGDPPNAYRRPLRSASDVSRALREMRDDVDDVEEQPVADDIASPDLLRLDPVIAPAGPPPGLQPPRRRPKAHEPVPPTTLERGRARLIRQTKGDRGLVLLGVAGAVLLLAVIGVLGFSGNDDSSQEKPPKSRPEPVRSLPIKSVLDFDPQGRDRSENPEELGAITDGDPKTGWRTSTYFNQPALGGLKDGVGVIIDLGSPSKVESMRIALAGEGTRLTVFSATAASELPRSPKGLRRITTIEDASTDTTVTFPEDTVTRQVVIWLESLPAIGEGRYRGEIREVSVRGSR